MNITRWINHIIRRQILSRGGLLQKEKNINIIKKMKKKKRWPSPRPTNRLEKRNNHGHCPWWIKRRKWPSPRPTYKKRWPSSKLTNKKETTITKASIKWKGDNYQQEQHMKWSSLGPIDHNKETIITRVGNNWEKGNECHHCQWNGGNKCHSD